MGRTDEKVFSLKIATLECDPLHELVLHRAEFKKGGRLGEPRETLPAISHADLEKSGIILHDLTEAAPQV